MLLYIILSNLIKVATPYNRRSIGSSIQLGYDNNVIVLSVNIYYKIHISTNRQSLLFKKRYRSPLPLYSTQSRIIGAVRGAHSQLWGTIVPVCSLYAARKYDRRFDTPAIV